MNSFRIAVIGDVHYGANYSHGMPNSLYGNTRLIDYKQTFDSTVDDIVESGITHLVLTGDIFESRTPSLVQQKVFSQSVHRALESGIKHIHIVIGNHDQARLTKSSTISYLQELNLPNVHVYDEITSVQIIEDNKVYANLIALPYRDRKWLGVDSYNEAISIIEGQIQYQLAGINNDAPKILVGHSCIEGTLFSDDETLELYGENQLFLPKRLFENIDITIMGHVHEPAIISKSPYIAYIGSMEKRAGFESHNKLYAIIDTEQKSVEYRKEPCREIYDIKLDYSHLSLGEALITRIKSDIDDFAKTHKMAESIVKMSLKINATDDKYVIAKQIYRYLKEAHLIHNCVEIRPELYSARQARNDKITEQTSDLEAFKLFLNTAVDDKDLRSEILSAGAEIIRYVEAQDVAG